MESTRSLGRNTLFSALSAASNVLLVVLVVLSANVLGDRAFGKFSFALAVASIFEMLVDLGLNTLVARNVARERPLAARYLPNILAWKMLLSVVAMGLLAVTVRLVQDDPEARLAALILGIGIVLRSYKSTTQAFFQSHERFDLILLTTYIERVLVAVAAVAALYTFGGLVPFCLAFVLARVPDLAFSLLLVHRTVTKVRFSADSSVIRTMQKDALPFASYALITCLYVYIGTVILSALRPAEEVGWYNAGYKIYEGLTMFPALLGAVMLPRLSRLFLTHREHHRYLAERAVKYLSIVSFPIALLAMYLSPSVVGLLFGKEYLPAVTPLRVLLAASIIMFTNITLNVILISADLQASVVRIASIGLVVMALTNILLVPRFHILGSALCVLISEVSVMTAALLTMRRRLFPMPVHAYSLRPLGSCMLSGLLVSALRVGPVPGALLFAGLYILVLALLRPLDDRERSDLRAMLRLTSGTVP